MAEIAWYMQLATLSVTGFLCYVILRHTIPEINKKHADLVQKLIDSCSTEKEGMLLTFTKEMKAVRTIEQDRRKRESERYHRLEKEIREGRSGSGEHKVQ